MAPISPTATTPLPLPRRQVVDESPDSTVTSVSSNRTRHNDIAHDTGAIVGIVIGSIVGLLLLVWAIRYCARRKRGSPPPLPPPQQQQKQHRSSRHSQSRPRQSSYPGFAGDQPGSYSHKKSVSSSSSRRQSHSVGPRGHSRRPSSARSVMVETIAPKPVYVYKSHRGRSPRGD